jgi:18S rRNA (guanine1575-N7)-methyltransferase
MRFASGAANSWKIFLQYYDDTVAQKYTSKSVLPSSTLGKITLLTLYSSTRIQAIQAQMTDRALELLNIPPGQPAMLLDIGCGSGLSGEILDEEGHCWVGIDVSPSMLEVALEREVEGDLFLHDIGQGLSFRPGSFDGAIRCRPLQSENTVSYSTHSISVLQWLCNAETSSPTSSPPFRLQRFFATLHASLTRGARAVFQFYPQSDDQVELIMSIAMRAGFQGGLVVDYPNSRKAKKFFLCLSTGGESAAKKIELPKALTGEPMDDEGDDVGRAKFEKTRTREGRGERGRKRKHPKEAAKDWILRKKEVINDVGTALTTSDIFHLAVQAAREGGCSPGFEVHWKKTKSRFLGPVLYIIP